MNTSKTKAKYLNTSEIIFICVETILFLLFIYMDIITSVKGKTGTPFVNALTGTVFLSSVNLKYYSIIICLLYSVYNLVFSRKRCHLMLTLAFIFTAASDYFLLLQKDIIIPGLLCFFIVHSIYLYVINGGLLKKTLINILVRMGFSLILTILIKISGIYHFANDSNVNGLMFLVLLYALSFIGNICRLLYFHLLNHKTGNSFTACLFKHKLLFLIGLILFLLCDLNVLIYNLGDFFEINTGIYKNLKNAADILMWAFYLPSQVLIALSGTDNK